MEDSSSSHVPLDPKIAKILCNLTSCAFATNKNRNFSYCFVCEGHFYHHGMDLGETIQIESYDPRLKEFVHWVTHFPLDESKVLKKEKQFIHSPLFRVVIKKSVSSSLIKQFACFGFLELITKLEDPIKNLLDRGYTYLIRNKPQTDFSSAISKYKTRSEQNAKRSKHGEIGEPLLTLDERLKLLVLDDYTCPPLINKLKDNQVVVTKDEKITKKLIARYYRDDYQGCFIRLEKNSLGKVKDCILVETENEAISIVAHPQFKKSTKPLTFFAQTKDLPFCSNWVETIVSHLFKHDFVFLYQYDDDFKLNQMKQIDKILKKQCSNIELIYQT